MSWLKGAGVRGGFELQALGFRLSGLCLPDVNKPDLGGL